MARQPDRLAGKVALITGAAQGIGRVLANVFAEAGASIIVSDVQETAGKAAAQAICDAEQRALFLRVDLRKEKDIKAMVELAVEAFGHLDIVINNARPRLRQMPFVESLEEWDMAMDVILKAPALIVKHALPHFLRSGGGSIVNIASLNALLISHQSVAYHVAKAGLLQLTRYLAVELGPQGIRVNAISPALVDLYDRKHLTSDPVNKTVTELVVPLKRAVAAEEIADVALFLCTDASSYITGQVLTLDGGLALGDQFYVARKAFRHAKGCDTFPAVSSEEDKTE